MEGSNEGFDLIRPANRLRQQFPEQTVFYAYPTLSATTVKISGSHRELGVNIQCPSPRRASSSFIKANVIMVMVITLYDYSLEVPSALSLREGRQAAGELTEASNRMAKSNRPTEGLRFRDLLCPFRGFRPA